MRNKYSQNLLDSAKKSAIDARKTASKKAIKKTAEANGDLTGNKISKISKNKISYLNSEQKIGLK